MCSTNYLCTKNILSNVWIASLPNQGLDNANWKKMEYSDVIMIAFEAGYACSKLAIITARKYCLPKRIKKNMYSAAYVLNF